MKHNINKEIQTTLHDFLIKNNEFWAIITYYKTSDKEAILRKAFFEDMLLLEMVSKRINFEIFQPEWEKLLIEFREKIAIENDAIDMKINDFVYQD